MEIQWNQLKDAADRETGFRFTPPRGEQPAARPGWMDRARNSWLSGSLPLLLVSAVTMAWMYRNGSSLAVLVGVAPLLVRFLRPLVTRGGVVRSGALVLVWPLLLVLSATAMLLPTVGVYRLRGDPLHAEILAVRLQENLEWSLTWEAVLSVLVVGVLAHLAVKRVESSNPWLDPHPSSRFSLGWRLGILLLVLVGLGWCQAQTRLGPEEKDWLGKMEEFYASRPFRSYPANSSDHFWRGRIEGLNAGETYRPLTLEAHVPTDLEEVDLAEAYFFRALPLELPPFPKAVTIVERVSLNLQMRPNGNRAYLDRSLSELLKLVAQSDLSAEQLDELKTRVKKMEGEIFDRNTELDQEAYRTLWAEDEEPEQRIGWYSPESVLSWQPEKKMGWTYNGIQKPAGLKALGMEFEWSPTRWLKRYQTARLTREWLKVSQETMGLERTEQISRFGQRRDALGHLDSREQEFWDSQLKEDQVTRERYLAEAVLTVIDLRLAEMADGQFPQTIESGFPWNPEEGVLKVESLPPVTIRRS